MKRFLIIVVGFMMCVLMTSCMDTYYTTKKINIEHEVREKWKGATRQQVINEFGPPNYEEPDGADGTILIYNMEHRSTDATLNRNGYIWIYLNSNNICTNLKSDYFYKYEQEKHTEIDNGRTIALVISLGLASAMAAILAFLYSQQ